MVGALLVVLVAPLVLALGVLREPRWYPMADLAMTELRVRDVLQLSHPPLIGLPGRITGYGEAGSHPGPLSFYALAPTYWLMGSTAFGLKVAVFVLDTVALGLVLWMVQRRGGALATLTAAAGLAVLLRAYGPHQLTEPWNPFMPPLWWVVFLVAVWCVLCGRLRALPLVVFAGSFCAQTHISYVPMVAVLLVLAVGWMLVDGHRRRAEPGLRRRTALWGGGSLLLLGLLWAPPIAEQFTNDPGNMAIMTENFRHPTQTRVSLGAARDIWLARIDPVALATGDPRAGSWVASLCGLLMLVLWLGSIVVARRRADLPGRRELLRLHLVVAVALAIGFVSLSRIIGVPWFYLHLWGMGTTLLLILATLWTAFAAAGRPLFVPAADTPGAADPDTAAGEPDTVPASVPTPWPIRERRVVVAGLLAVVLVVTGMFTSDAAYTEIPVPRLTRTLRHVAPDTVAALTAPDAPGGGKNGRYLVQWIDPIGIGEHGWGLLDELERHGLHVYVDTSNAVPARFHRLLEGRPPTAIVTVVGGEPLIDDFRQDPERRELAYFEPRSPAERARFDELRTDVQSTIDDMG
ncbi:MAG TPA: hypothetical protein VGO78_02045, partial [Acidimicrobiales bacterium]|nr:hypothetical protein [Acidimicrobiales bacterium]